MERLIEIIKKGAEAILWKGEWFGLPAVFKHRIEKRYRSREFDRMLRVKRTINEAKLMIESRKLIEVPFIYDVDLERTLIVMEYIEGKTLKDLLLMGSGNPYDWGFEVGIRIGKLHRGGIVHGDLTTSNIIIRKDHMYFIDFGLGSKNPGLEEMGIDLHLMLRALESLHHEISAEFFEGVMKGYEKIMGRLSENVKKKIREIRMRGRYVWERRAPS